MKAVSLIRHTPMNVFVTPKTVERVSFTQHPLEEELRHQLIDECLTNSDEVCGFISAAMEYYPIANSHPEPHANFHMQDDLVAPTLQEICKINESRVIGIFHTHPNNVPWPSPMDLAGWPNKALGWRYWIVTKHDVVEWIYHK